MEFLERICGNDRVLRYGNPKMESDLWDVLVHVILLICVVHLWQKIMAISSFEGLCWQKSRISLSDFNFLHFLPTNQEWTVNLPFCRITLNKLETDETGSFVRPDFFEQTVLIKRPAWSTHAKFHQKQTTQKPISMRNRHSGALRKSKEN